MTQLVFTPVCHITFCLAGIFKTFAAGTCHWTLWQLRLTGCFYWGLLKAEANGRAITFMGSLRWHPCILDGLLNRSHQPQWFCRRRKQKQGGYFSHQHNANRPPHPSSSVCHNDYVIGRPAGWYVATGGRREVFSALSELWCNFIPGLVYVYPSCLCVVVESEGF